MAMKHQITRRIEIDAGHRIPLHGSKCKNIHGHRYVILATVKGELASDGAEAGMVMDFGFIKAAMVYVIERVYDHALILWRGDEVLSAMKRSGRRTSGSSTARRTSPGTSTCRWRLC